MIEDRAKGEFADPCAERSGGCQTSPALNRGNLMQQMMRAKAIQGLGGVCMVCGSQGSPDNKLEFHHRIREQTKNSNQRLKDTLAHPEKFLLLCRVDHLALHRRELKRSGRADTDSFMDLKAVRSEIGRNYPAGLGE